MPVDPDVARLLADARAKDPRGIEQLSVAEARVRGGSAPVGAMVAVQGVPVVACGAIGGTHGRIYRPAAGMLPLLVYFHGGGWVVGSVTLSDNFCRALANASGCAVLSVEYRLAPEHRYPAAADDAYAATAWAHENARE